MSDAALSSPSSVADDAPHILVIDDDQRIRTLLRRYLTDHGFRVDVAADAEEARARLGGLSFDLLILDVMMPGENGFDLLASLRQTMQVPVLMLTARAEIEHRITGLERGADDYLGKPFEPRELVLRVNAILKRGAPPPEPLIEQLRFGPFTFHLGRRELKRGAEPVRLTDRERQIMAVFAASPNETVPRLDLLSGDEPAGERTIDVQINRLRRKIEVDPTNPLYLQTVRGIGYRLVTEA